MLTSRITAAIILFTTFGLLVTTPLPAAARFPIVDATHWSSHTLQDVEPSEGGENDEEEEEEEDSGGWLDTVIDTGSDVVVGAKDTTVSTAATVWDATQDAPGAAWGVIEQAPGAIWGAANDGWSWLRNASTKTITWEAWAAFLAEHPLIGTLLGPLVLILFGLSPDGSISVLDISLAGLLSIIPAAKGFQVLRELATPFLPRLTRGEDVVSAVTRVPALLRLDPADLIAFLRARTVNPTLGVIAKLPSSPGVYVILDANGTPIYVGMSNSIQRRLTQHFTPPKSVFADEATTIKTISRKSSTDALNLECRLIKAFRPKYNVIHNNDRSCPIYVAPMAPVFP